MIFVLRRVSVLAKWGKDLGIRWDRITAHAVLCGLAFLGSATTSLGSELKPIKLRPDYQHDRYVTQPTEIVRQFEAFTVSFDSKEDDGEARGIPDFVAYEMKRLTKPLGAGPARPAAWITDQALAAKVLAPTDASYQYSAVFLLSHRDWYERGHLCMKQHAWRLGANADWNTHTVLNAVPQRASFNKGIWRDLEDLTAAWADQFVRVWIITGPIFDQSKPRSYVGEAAKKEMPVAIPDALFKIVIRETTDPKHPEVLAFWFPQQHPKYKLPRPRDLAFFLVSVDEIERATGLDFLTALPDESEATIEATKASRLW